MAHSHPLSDWQLHCARQPARHIWQVRRYFGKQLDWIMPGALGGNRKPSRIIGIVSGQQLR